ncbi:endoplasmic reticulum vesicle transporter-domain-containing protein [Spinellus fusiger]|nr:endoplasmic reticulum vesicle transporter-domain-containing protein [Spinellus fusiger]
MTQNDSLLSRFRHFDGYAKTMDDFRVKTTIGALVTVVSTMIIIFLVFFELNVYRTPVWRPELVVDKGRKEKMTIHFNITFPKMPCHMLSVDIMDDSGDHISGYTHDVYKVRLDLMGVELTSEKEKTLGDNTQKVGKVLQEFNPCGSCYGATSPRGDNCCNTCEEVRTAYVNMGWGLGDPDKIDQCLREGWRERIETQSNEGCNIHGKLLVNKVRGNFHIAPGQAFQQSEMHIHDIKTFITGAPDGHTFDLTHHIHRLKFGPDTEETSAAIAAITDTLAGTDKKTERARVVYQYFLKIVSTELKPLSGASIYTNQYSVTQNERSIQEGGSGLPGVFFNMDISPMLIIYHETRPSFTSFITGVFSIVGGVFTVAGLLDRVIYRAGKTLKKMDTGKTF